MRKGNKYKPDVSFRINYEIHAPTVRLLDDQGAQIGILSLSEAKKLSEEKSLDLVEVAPMAQPPVVKLIDYNKFLYQIKKITIYQEQNLLLDFFFFFIYFLFYK